MGTTLTAAQTGNLTFAWVAAIEGFRYLFTDGSASAAVTAWSGTEWSEAKSGLTVSGDWSQELDPWNPFPDSGTLRLAIQPDDDDVCAPMFKNAPRAEDSFLAADIDSNDATITVDGTSGLASPVYIGTERITFTGSTATTLTGCTRGRKSPFSTDGGTAYQFGRPHRATTHEATTQLRPVVGDAPRVWVGKWVGLWMHRVVGGVLDVASEAHLSFAGRIVSISDDPQTGCTIIEVEHLAEMIPEIVIGRDAWTARIQEGVTLREGDSFTWSDSNDVAGYRTSGPLTCVTGATGVDEIEPGRYTVTEICSALNAWLAAEKAAPRIGSNVSFASPVQDSAGVMRTSITVHDGTVGGGNCPWVFRGPSRILNGALGFEGNGSSISGVGREGRRETTWSADSPIRATLYHQQLLDDPVDIADEVGTFFDSYADLPPDAKAWADANGGSAGTWGIFRFGDFVFTARYSAGTLTYIKQYQALSEGPDLGTGMNGVFLYGSEGSAAKIAQLFFVSGEWSTLVAKVFASTGTSGYNHGTYDTLPAPLGAGIPWSLLGDDFVDSLGQLDAAGTDATFVIDKPTTIKALLGDDLIARRAGLVFKNGTFRFARWSTPGAAESVSVAFTEANKAAPVGTSMVDKSAMLIDSSDQRCTVKLRFNRRGINSDEYGDSITLQDRVAIDDGGDARVATVSLRNTFARLGEVNEDEIRAIGESFLATFPLFSRPAKLITRSIAPSMFEGVAPGDVCTVTDGFARNPDTGARGLSAYRGVVVRTRYDWGGADAGDAATVRDMGGEVTIMLVDDDRTRPYCYAAQVDNTATGGGYDSGTFTLTCYNHAHSESALGVKDAERFQAGDSVRILEIDPATPGSEISWTRTVASTSGTSVVLTSGLSAPAWDAAKRYRIIPNDYASAGRFQSFAYLADAADSLIINTTRAHHYAGSAQAGKTQPADTDLPERHGTTDLGDGKPYHVGTDRAVCRGLNNLRRSKTRRQAPTFLDTFHQVDEAANWDILAVQLINVRDAAYASTSRTLDVVARWRSATGASSSLRITATRAMPSQTVGDPDDSPSYTAPYSQSSTFTTSSTTYGTSSHSIPVGIADANGLMLIVVEGKIAAQFSGFQEMGETVTGVQLRENWWCRNGLAPQGEFISLATNRLRSIWRRDTKMVFSHLGTYALSTSTAGTRHRWRFAFRSGTLTGRVAIAWVIAPSTIVTTESYCTFRLTDVAAATDVDKIVHVGAVETPKATVVPLSDCWYGISYIDCDPSKDYECRVTDFGGARVVTMAVWLEASSTPLATPFVSVGSPILDSQREFLLESVTNTLNNDGAHLFNWTAHIGGVPRSTTSTTARNLFDDTSAAVSSTTPGMVPQVSNSRTLTQTGVPVTFKVYGSRTGAGNCEVTLRNSAGTTIATITINSSTAAWYTTTATLTDSDSDKYDVFYKVTAASTTGNVNHLSCYIDG